MIPSLYDFRRPHEVYIYRASKWIRSSSNMIVPGDIISVVRPKDQALNQKGVYNREDTDILCPCDVMLLRGSCVSNEAMLTGESIPQLKDPADSLPVDDLDRNLEVAAGTTQCHKKHVVFGGTKVLQHSPAKPSDSSLCTVPQPPDGGCVGCVLRTGFGTSQGQLMRTILFSVEHVTANNGETLLFLAFLLVFGLVASAYVLKKGLEDEMRSRFKLMLHCIMIITSVVPPELPMELSLAVNNSLLVS